MKRALSRGEWLLIGGPVVGFGIFAAVWARWKAITPAILSPSPVPLFSVRPAFDGRSVIGLGHQLDSLNVPKPNTPWQLMRWDAKTGAMVFGLAQNRYLWSWAVSHDGKYVALYSPGLYNSRTRTNAPSALRVLTTILGEEVASWTVLDDEYIRSISFSPGGSEVILLGKGIRRFSLATKKLLGTLPASALFSRKSRIEQIRFSPNGRLVALREDEFYPGLDDSKPPPNITPVGGVFGAHIVICEYPSMHLIARVRGDLYSDCDWESNAQLLAIAPLMAGYDPQKLVCARFNVETKTTQFDTLELPIGKVGWWTDSLAINGPTSQVFFQGSSQLVVWGRDGQQETNFAIRSRDIPNDPTNRAIPRFSADGRSIFRVNGTEVERYDLSRFLPETPPA
ncbi:hypothetical protein IAD21_01567 [Abditibacteriota bacterium]|nr:hypothetical protein IAD21_01567 [Abditibacteriota bacterium]